MGNLREKVLEHNVFEEHKQVHDLQVRLISVQAELQRQRERVEAAEAVYKENERLVNENAALRGGTK